MAFHENRPRHGSAERDISIKLLDLKTMRRMFAEHMRIPVEELFGDSTAEE
jgi:hypothetical protein